jgi:20S proteasome alpha/beta subunit
VGFIIAGINRIEKDFEIYNFQSPEFIPKRVGSGSLLAGQWHIAKFFVNRLYTENMHVDKLTELAALLLNETMAVEKTVGGTIRLATITNSNGFRWVLEAEVKSITKKNELFRKFFKEHFHSSLLSAVNNDRE